MKQNNTGCRYVALTALALWASGALAKGGTVEFVVDPSQSQLTLSGNILGSPFTEQAPGSLTTSYSGTFTATESNDGIQFTGGKVAAADNGIWQPIINGGAADYAAHADPVVGPLDCALRNIVFSPTSQLIAFGNNEFDSLGMVFSFTSDSVASFDLKNQLVGTASVPMGGTAKNIVSNGGSLRLINGVQQLILNLDLEFTVSGVIEDDTVMHLTGKLMATQVAVPSLTSWQLLGQTMTVKAQGIGPADSLQVSTDCKTWTSQPANRTDYNDGTSMFTFTTTGTTGFFRVGH